MPVSSNNQLVNWLNSLPPSPSSNGEWTYLINFSQQPASERFSLSPSTTLPNGWRQNPWSISPKAKSRISFENRSSINSDFPVSLSLTMVDSSTIEHLGTFMLSFTYNTCLHLSGIHNQMERRRSRIEQIFKDLEPSWMKSKTGGQRSYPEYYRIPYNSSDIN